MTSSPLSKPKPTYQAGFLFFISTPSEHLLQHASQFIHTTINQSIPIAAIFFYGSSVPLLFNPIHQTHWQQLAQHAKCPFWICESAFAQLKLTAIPDGFSAAGLGQFFKQCREADRLIQF